MDFSPDGRWLASGSFDHTVRLWSVFGGAPVRTLKGHTEAVVSVAFSPDGQWLASGGDDSKVRIWRVDTTAAWRTLDNDARHVYGVAFSPDGRYLAAGGRDKGPLGEIAQKMFGATRAGGRGTSIRVWEVERGLVAATLAGHDDDVNDLQFSADGRWLASAGEDRTVVLWGLGR